MMFSLDHKKTFMTEEKNLNDDSDWGDFEPLSQRGGYRGKEFDALSLSDNSEFPTKSASRQNLMELLNDNETEGGDFDFHPNIIQDIPEEVDWRGGMAYVNNEHQNHFVEADDLSYN